MRVVLTFPLKVAAGQSRGQDIALSPVLQTPSPHWAAGESLELPGNAAWPQAVRMIKQLKVRIRKRFIIFIVA